MSRFEQLQATHSDSNSLNRAYWQDLASMVEKIGKDFEVYLGVPAGLLFATKNTAASAVSIGSLVDESHFKVMAPESLPQSGSAIPFALRLIVDDVGSQPSPQIIFSLSVSKSDKGYPVVLLSDPTEPAFNGPIHTQLFEKMYAFAMKHFSTRL
ncbi:hypothetical protein PSYCIT7_020700 [Pseudomonas syringae Cit 7]|uniref:Uncharacterized protein n=1 Tax=Pseudomonas syringae Cit 7 TaxID=629264 RepID=A0A8T8LUN6_PSESX|nr:hypothetical protein [Pseudomonas syringae]QUP65201.1 hypothetical protein PSYCIT7_020700 [Pseudomonas syringae Cit 7]